MAEIPKDASQWIDDNLPILRTIQKMTKVLGALSYAEMSEEYQSKFHRDLLADLIQYYTEEGNG